MIFLSSVAATLVFFDHSGDIIHINYSTSVGVEPTNARLALQRLTSLTITPSRHPKKRRQTLQYTPYIGSISTIFLCRIMIFLSSEFIDHLEMKDHLF